MLTRAEVEGVEAGDSSLRADLRVAIAERTRGLHLHIWARLRVIGYRVEDVGSNWHTIVPGYSFDDDLKSRSARPLKQRRTVVADADRRKDTPIGAGESNEHDSRSAARRRARSLARGRRWRHLRQLQELGQVSGGHHPVAVDVRTCTLAGRGPSEQAGHEGIDVVGSDATVTVRVTGHLGRRCVADDGIQRRNANDATAEAGGCLPHAHIVAKNLATMPIGADAVNTRVAPLPRRRLLPGPDSNWYKQPHGRSAMAKKKGTRKAEASQIVSRLQSNMKRLQREAEGLLGRTRKQAAQLISRDQRRALDRILSRAKKVRTDIEKRAERASKAVESRAERFLSTLEKETAKRLSPLVKRLDLPSRREIEALSRRIGHLEKRMRSKPAAPRAASRAQAAPAASPAATTASSAAE